MLVTKLLLASLALLTTAAAAPGADAGALSDLVERDGPKDVDHHCPKDTEWNGYKRECVCKNEDIEPHTPGCQDVPDKPHCGKDETPYCCKESDKFAKYGKDEPICHDPKKTKTFCCKSSKDAKGEAKKACPPRPPKDQCKKPLLYDYFEKRCECPKGKVLDHNGKKCVWKPLEPKCKKGSTAYCAKSPSKFTKYDKWAPLCGDNGRNIIVCVYKNPQKECESGYTY